MPKHADTRMAESYTTSEATCCVRCRHTGPRRPTPPPFSQRRAPCVLLSSCPNMLATLHSLQSVSCTNKLVTLAACCVHCRHTVSELGPGFVSEMRKPLRTRTYAQAKPKALTDEQW